MKLAVVGTRDVGLVTRVSLSEIGHHVTCINSDEAKGEKKKRSRISPVDEPDLSQLIIKNIKDRRLVFILYKDRYNEVDGICTIAVRLENKNLSKNFKSVGNVVTTIALTAKNDTIVVTKSTVPVGTNDRLRQIIDRSKLYHIYMIVLSYPKFLIEESYALFHYKLIRYNGRNYYHNNENEKLRYGYFPIESKVLSRDFSGSFGSWCGF